jgi:large subunit ribosomal protein L4e
MKIPILDQTGKKIKERETDLFAEPIREDLIYKIVETEKVKHPYAPYYLAGIDRSASGIIRHRRRDWKSDRGRGIPRLPRKVFWRRGTQFSWEATVVPFAKGGRRAHPPKILSSPKKINKKEMKKALLSALSYSCSIEELKKKYTSMKNKEIEIKFPIVVDEKILELKTKDFFDSLSKILGELNSIAVQKRAIRAGRGKSRGRRHKKNAGVLFVIGKNEEKNINGIEIVESNKLKVSDLADNGARLTIFTEKAIDDLENKFIKNKSR